MKEITLTLDLVNALMQYIGTRPYAEVHQLIAEVQRQAAGQVQSPEDSETSEMQGKKEA
jgi:hypothetical protein